MSNRSVHDLNHLILNQEAMIESYGRMVSGVKDSELKNRLKFIQENHFEQMMALSDRVMELGGNPKFEMGLRGIKDDMNHYRDRSEDTTDLENARSALDSERIDSEKLLSYDLSEVDSISNELLQKAAKKDQENMKVLEEYIKQIELQ